MAPKKLRALVVPELYCQHMSFEAPYRLTEPVRPTGSAVFSSPHSGDCYPDHFLRQARLDKRSLRASEDAFVDRLFESVPLHGAPLISATAPRAWIDLNRSPGELDPALIDGVRSSGLNQRIVAGLGVVPRVVSENRPIYDGKISRAEADDRIRGYHEPYHQRLEALLTAVRERHGAAILFDCHSMPSEALRAAPRVRGSAPQIVLGDRFGASAGRSLVALAQAVFERAGFAVARNAPFAGGYITQRYGRPARGIHAIQIEIDRGLYLDQTRIEPLPEFGAVKRQLDAVIRELVDISHGLSSVAAE